MLSLLLCCQSCGGAPLESAGKDTGTAQPGLGAGPDADSDGGMLDGGTGGEAGPVGEPQSLADWSEGSIGPWGPVVQTVQVNVSGGGDPIPVNRLASEDPFTGVYQLPNGRIIATNGPLEDILAVGYVEPWPQTELWYDGGDELLVIVPQIVLSLLPSMSESDIVQFIQREQLYTIFSWYIPDLQTGGNTIATFQFEYDPLMYPSFGDAYDHLTALPEVEYAEPNTLGEFEPHYSPNSGSGPLIPDDEYYEDSSSRYVSQFGIDYSMWVPIGPEESGGWFSDQVVAVIDSGVYRYHEDFAFL